MATCEMAGNPERDGEQALAQLTRMNKMLNRSSAQDFDLAPCSLVLGGGGFHVTSTQQRRYFVYPCEPVSRMVFQHCGSKGCRVCHL